MIGDRILKYRKKYGLSQEELGQKLNVSRQSISKWETNQSTPEVDKILLLCDVFHLSTDELIKGESIESNKQNHHYDKRVILYSIIVIIIAICFIPFAQALDIPNDLIATSVALVIFLSCVYSIYNIYFKKR